MKLWVDDIRPAPKGWIWAKTGWEAIRNIVYHDFEEISFDHDLGDEDAWTGYSILCWIEKTVEGGGFENLPEFSIHTANPVGRKNMERAIESIKKLTL